MIIHFLIVPFVLVNISKIPFLFWMLVYGGLYIIWACFYKKYIIWKVKKNIKKRLNEGNNNGGLGEKTFEICGDKIIETSEFGKSSTNIKSVENIFINEVYIYIYINNIQAYIVLIRAFINEKEKEEFIKNMKSIKN